MRLSSVRAAYRVARPTAALAATATLAAGCGGDPLRPADVAAVYVLRSVADEPLPAVTFTGNGYTSRAVADTLWLNADGTGRSASAVTSEALATGRREAASYAQAVRYRVAGGRVSVEYLCPPNALCAEPPHLLARVEAGGLLVEQALGGRVPRWYARVGP